MYSIAFVIPYFGKLPDYFPVWLNSCGQNPSIDFFVFTDDDQLYNYPSNVHKVEMQFDEVKGLIQKQFDFPIALTRPYKLCDYRPMYGEVFAKWLNGFDFWGHCDLDVVWGNIRHFFTDDLMDKYDRIMWLGHCSIFRNCKRVNQYYKTLDPMGCMDWREVCQNEKNYSFDEYAEHNGGGFSMIMEKNGIPMYKEWLQADLCVGLSRFQLSYTENRYYSSDADSFGSFFQRNREGLFLHYRKNGQYMQKEFLYVHFQKRMLKISEAVSADSEQYLILPPGRIICCSVMTPKKVKRYFSRNVKAGLMRELYNDATIVKFARRALRKLSK